MSFRPCDVNISGQELIRNMKRALCRMQGVIDYRVYGHEICSVTPELLSK